MIAALVAAAISVGVRSSSNSSANKSTSTAAALGEFVTYDASSSSSKSGKSGTSKSSYSGSAKSSKSSPKSSPFVCPVGFTDEGEECRTSTSGPDTFNGGCADTPPYVGNSGFSNITFGESICGTVSTWDAKFGDDQDWYKFEVSTDTTVDLLLTTDFGAVLFLDRLGDDDDLCDFSEVAEGTDVGDNTYFLSANVTAGDYSITFDYDNLDSSLSCRARPGNYILTLFNVE